MGTAITTTKQANTLSKTFTDLDFYRRRYTIVEDNNNEKIVVQFVAPQLASYEEYRFTLLKNSTTKQLKPIYFFRPDYVSYEEYGTTNLWALLLFINDIATIEEFNKEVIFIPTLSIINSISTESVKREMYNDIVPLYEIPVKEKAKLYYHKKPIFKSQIAPLNEPIFTKPDLYYNRETIVLTTIMCLQRYFDLTYEPVLESLKINIQGQPNYIYDKHYTMINGTSGKNRLTWNPRVLSGGPGLMNVMLENVTVEVMYARKMQ